MRISIAAVKVMYRRAVGRPTVEVWDTNFGYIIRSEKAPEQSIWRGGAARTFLCICCAAAVAVWLMPFIDTNAWRAAISAVLFTLGAWAYIYFQSFEPGIELHVDTSRKELRAAATTPSGELWIHATADFDDVVDIFLRRPKPDVTLMSLCLRLVAREAPMPVAVGDEAALLAVHDRLAQDLQPALDRRIDSRRPGPASPGARSSVFPRLGPGEQSA